MPRLIIFAVILVHGAIHSFGIAPLLGAKVNTQAGRTASSRLLWLTALVLFLASGVLLLIQHRLWFWFCLAAIVVSQMQIVRFWTEAKFGTFVNVMLLIGAFLLYRNDTYYDRYVHDVHVASSLPAQSPGVLTEEDIAPLPEAIKKYIRLSNALGKPRVQSFKVMFTGKIRKNDSSSWMPFTSEQYNFLSPARRLFFMNAKMMGLPVAGYHHYDQAKAFMDIRLFSLVRVQYLDGPLMDHAETVTFFNDMCCMAPATLIDPRITWGEATAEQVDASFTVNGITIYASLYFDANGRLINFISNDRVSADAGEIYPWETPLRDYKTFHDHLLATSAQTIYDYPSGRFVYGTFHTEDVVYNPAVRK